MWAKYTPSILSTLSKATTTSPQIGRRYIGLTLQWDYRNRTVRLSMPGYCEKAGQRFHHSLPTKPQHQPYPSAPRTYGSKQQLCATADTSPALGKQQKTFVQEVIGVFLYYARAVDCTMLTALGSLATQQAKPTTTTLDRVSQFLDYALSHPNAGVTYRASDVIAAQSDASYLSESNARSRAGGHFFLSEMIITPTTMGLSSTFRKSSKSLCLPLLRPNSVRYTSMPVKSFPCDTSFSKWATHNHPLPCKLTTLPPLVL
eukprot:CCRYP_017704-RA/>CCRYP_017704-RA protein AED:0.43 eAED:0.43 QI:0/0/0/1/0/0/2/0/258